MILLCVAVFLASIVLIIAKESGHPLLATFIVDTQKKLILIEKPDYTVSIQYPHTGNIKVDPVVDKLIRDESVAFAEDKPAKAEHGWQYQLYIRYVSSSFSKDIVCYKFEVYSFMGGAHGNTKLVTKVININTGKIYGLDDVFRSGSGYLTKISDICIAYLTNKLGKIADPKWIGEGAGPKKVNYQDFVLDGRNIVFYFEQYQVAPYSEGVQEVKVPLSSVKQYLQEAFIKQ
jgi:hypothetical protein